MTEILPMSPAFEALWDASITGRGTLLFSGHGASYAYRDEVRFAGLEHGKLTVLATREVPGLPGLVITLHEKGSSYWASRGQRGYGAAEIHTVIAERRGSRSYRYVKLTSVPAATNDVQRDETTARAVARLIEGVVPNA